MQRTIKRALLGSLRWSPTITTKPPPRFNPRRISNRSITSKTPLYTQPTQTQSQQTPPRQPLFSDDIKPSHQSHFSFSRDNINIIPERSPHPHAYPDMANTESIPIDRTGRPITLLSEELRAQNINIHEPSPQSAFIPPQQYVDERHLPRFLDATQPELTAVQPLGDLINLQSLLIILVGGVGIGAYSLYDLWLNERVYLSSSDKLQAYIKENELDAVFSEAWSREKLSEVYRSVINTAAANEGDFLDMQRLLNKHLMIGLVLLESTRETQSALKEHRAKLHTEINAIDPESIVIKYYTQLENEEKNRESWPISLLKYLYDKTDKPFWLALADLIKSIQPPPDPIRIKTVIEILGLDEPEPIDTLDSSETTAGNPDNSNNGQINNESTATTTPILTPELLSLYSRLQEVEHYLVMTKSVNEALEDDTRDLFEQYACPSFVIHTTKQTPDLIQSITTSFATINSTKMILQLLNFWLLYEQTKQVFPSLIPFEQVLKLWNEIKPYDPGVVGRLVQEEQEHQLYLAAKHQEEIISNSSRPRRSRRDQTPRPSLFDGHDNSGEDGNINGEENGDQSQQQQSETESDRLSRQLSQIFKIDEKLDSYGKTFGQKQQIEALFDQMIRVPGTLLAQEPPRYQLPFYLHPQHAAHYVTQIFNTPSFIPKTKTNPNGIGVKKDTNDEVPQTDAEMARLDDLKAQMTEEERQRDEIIAKFAAAPTIKAIILSSTLSPIDTQLLFSPPKPNDIIDLSLFQKDDILIAPKKGSNFFRNGGTNQSSSFTNTLLGGGERTGQDELGNEVLLGFVRELKEKGLPLNQEMIQMTFFAIVPFLKTHFYQQINPVPRVDFNSPNAAKLSAVYALQQKYLDTKSKRGPKEPRKVSGKSSTQPPQQPQPPQPSSAFSSQLQSQQEQTQQPQQQQQRLPEAGNSIQNPADAIAANKQSDNLENIPTITAQMPSTLGHTWTSNTRHMDYSSQETSMSYLLDNSLVDEENDNDQDDQNIDYPNVDHILNTSVQQREQNSYQYGPAHGLEFDQPLDESVIFDDFGSANDDDLAESNSKRTKERRNTKKKSKKAKKKKSQHKGISDDQSDDNQPQE